MRILRALAGNPKYALMRGLARFSQVRTGVTRLKGVLTNSEVTRYERILASRMCYTMFPDLDRFAFLDALVSRGCGFGITLPLRIIEAVREYADTHPAYAYRNERWGFLAGDRAKAEAALGKEILLAQYYNSEHDCSAIREVASDPLINWIALRYLGSVPRFLGCNLWWTYPIRASREDRLKHAHFFHRDIDDFKFLKFFFYLTDVRAGDGAHWLVAGSHRKPPYLRFADRFVLRRFEDVEIQSFYDRADILEVVGSEGAGFAEDTLCVHKAASPTQMPRLLLQLQFALFDFGAARDRRDPSELRMLSDGVPAGMAA